MAEQGSYDNVTGPGTPVGQQDWYIGYSMTVRLPADMDPAERAIILSHDRVNAALGALSREPITLWQRIRWAVRPR